MADNHTHEFTKLKLFRITKITNPYYIGSSGDKAFVTYVCRCGKATPIDYGTHESMKLKFEALRGKDELKARS